MKKLTQTIHINAPVETVWNVMLGDATYREWVKEFNPNGSYFEGDWSEGSTMKFLGPNPDDAASEHGGIESRVVANKLHEFISLEHVAVIGPNTRDTESEEAKKWISSHENYTFTPAPDGGTDLTVEIDVHPDYYDMFVEMWQRAMERIREIAEK